MGSGGRIILTEGNQNVRNSIINIHFILVLIPILTDVTNKVRDKTDTVTK